MLRRLAVFMMAAVPLLASCGQRPLLTVAVQRVTVQPNASVANEAEDIPYSLGAPAHVTISLLQPDGQQQVLRDNDRDAESYALPFGGIVSVPNSSDRRVLKDGDYKIVFQAKGAAGQTAQQTVDAVVQNADPVPLDITDIALSLPTFSPNGQGMRDVNGHPENEDQTTFNYSLSKEARVSISVVDKDGNPSPVMAETVTKPGLQQYIWDGKGPNGIALKDGVYAFHIKALDDSGNVTDRTGQVTIQGSGTPQVQIVSAQFGPKALGIGGTLNVEVTIKNTGDVAIKTQGPPPGTVFSSNSSYTDPLFNKPGDQEPPFEDKPGFWRVGVRWTSSAGQYPARWGFFDDSSRMLQPGEQVTVRGGIKILAPQPPELTFWATIEMGGLGFTGDYGQTKVIVGH